MKFRLVSFFSVILMLVCIVASFSSCGESGNEENSTGYEYIPSGSEITTAANQEELQQKFTVDTSWQKNFYVKYSHYNPEQSIATMHYEEKRSENAFTYEYLDAGSLQYYKANENGIEFYSIMKNENEQTRTVLSDNFSELSSLFMKLSEVDADFPSQNNVLYMYDEEVAGRNCHKYIQRAYSGGKLTKTVYIWVDAQYGFYAKLEEYDAENKLTFMFATESFSAGNMKDEDVIIDTSKYTFKEAVG